MFANGDIYPCELLIDRKLGNVREAGYDFKKIWFSAGGRRRRASSSASRSASAPTSASSPINILFNP